MHRYLGSEELLTRSRQILAAGVSSGMRANCKPVPLFFQRGSGSHVTDVSGNEYVDYTLAWGPLILGYNPTAVVEAVREQLDRSFLFGAQHELEWRVAEKIREMVPCAELVAFSNTGSEAVQVAIRLARAYSGRQKIIRFEGHYHGWLDNTLIGYRPAPDTPIGKVTAPGTAGFNPATLQEVRVLPWNDFEQVEKVLEEHHQEIAAIITEPILCNCGCLMPLPGYLQRLRDLATRYSVVLIFDEVITGFRVAPGGAQSLFGVTPDLAVFAKAVAGGFPLSVIAGRRSILELIERGQVIHAGTFNGNPVSLAAANATLGILQADGGSVLQTVRKNGEVLMAELAVIAAEQGIPVSINGVGSAFHVAFTQQRELRNYRDTLTCNLEARDQFLQAMLDRGVYLLPDGRWYVSAAHTSADLDATLSAARAVFATKREALVHQA